MSNGTRKRQALQKPAPEAAALSARIEVLEGVLIQLGKEAQKRIATTQSPERERWEWVSKVTAAGLSTSI